MRKTAFFVVFFGVMLVMVPCLALAEAETAPLVDLTPLVRAAITLMAALITYRLVPWIKARTTEQQQANLSALASTLVYAAEQLFGANRGAEKLAYVTDILRERGYDVDSQEVLAVVEAAVNQMTPKAYCFAQADVDASSDEQSGAE